MSLFYVTFYFLTNKQIKNLNSTEGSIGEMFVYIDLGLTANFIVHCWNDFRKHTLFIHKSESFYSPPFLKEEMAQS